MSKIVVLVVFLAIDTFCQSESGGNDLKGVKKLEYFYAQSCGGAVPPVLTPIKNQSNPKFDFQIREQNEHILKAFIQYQIEPITTEPVAGQVSNFEQIKAVLKLTFDIYKEIFPPQFSVLKAFLDTVQRHIIELAAFTSYQRASFYMLDEADQGRLVGALEECMVSATNKKLKFYFNHCDEKVLSIDSETNFICPEKCSKNVTSFDPIIKTYINVINAISNFCFESLEKPKAQIFHGWKLELLDLITEQVRMRWSYGTEKLKRWIGLLGPTFLTNMDITTAVAKHIKKNSKNKFSFNFKGLPFNIQLIGTISHPTNPATE